MITCYLRYVIDPDKLEEFEHYGRMWMPLIEKFGGAHHGYFLPGEGPKDAASASFSFPGLATAGPGDVAVALFSFPISMGRPLYEPLSLHRHLGHE
ncbi:MAG TPA: hypothetical protein VJL59_14540 [Anaerolineales bacterium]|nr:hypothetical protein [Anaerolineales bacterium]